MSPTHLMASRILRVTASGRAPTRLELDAAGGPPEKFRTGMSWPVAQAGVHGRFASEREQPLRGGVTQLHGA